MQDAADHAAIIHPILAAYVRRQMRLDPSPLLVVQPKQVASHDRCSHRQRIIIRFSPQAVY
jgi:hypothetical protein